MRPKHPSEPNSVPPSCRHKAALDHAGPSNPKCSVRRGELYERFIPIFDNKKLRQITHSEVFPKSRIGFHFFGHFDYFFPVPISAASPIQ